MRGDGTGQRRGPDGIGHGLRFSWSKLFTKTGRGWKLAGKRPPRTAHAHRHQYRGPAPCRAPAHPRAIFDYADRGSYDEASLRANREDLQALKLRQRVMIDVSDRNTATTMLGEPVTMPVGIAPTGLTGLFHADGEILGCRAAHAFGVPFTLSTMSICSIEDVAGAVDKPFWFQLYVMRDRGFSRSLVERAIAAKCSALVLTLDLQIQGQRHNDIKNGLAVPPKLTLRNMLDVATKPLWAMKVLQGKRKSFGNLADAPGAKEGLNTLSHWIAGQFDPRSPGRMWSGSAPSGRAS
ncbi:alpha-hydroxy-acid oxidizing protein [Pseudoroseomonas wenyumeiae]